jgi:uncharacterized protein (DUF924 family)
MTMRPAADVLDFWFRQHGRSDWYGGGPEFDAKLAREFSETHAHVALGEAYEWRATAEGRLAEIIILDQFSRQLFRGNAKAFAYDNMALVLAQEAVRGGYDQTLPAGPQRMFLYLPYMHSESLLIHEEAMRLYAALDLEEPLRFEAAHVACLKRFGRYPRRNAALGRESTPEELAYIASDQDRW